jgi:S-disulfanyl-L-cysteine oxidoreductase SoxD
MSPGKYVVFAVAIAFVAAASWTYFSRDRSADTVIRLDPNDKPQALGGRAIYERHCASCHGQNLEGQPNWRTRLPNGRLPAPPHDGTGHTWHHPDAVLFGIVKHGLVPPYAPPGYASDMPAFQSTLTDDEIRAVLAYIESTWSAEIVKMRREMTGR